MEEFDGIFIAKTNLMEGLDMASLRRFNLKLAFGWLRSEQMAKMLRNECALLSVCKPSAAALNRLVEECAVKEVGEEQRMGFVWFVAR